MVVGYVIMRVPLIGLWLRAARQDPAHRRVDVAYAVAIAVAQIGWILTAVLPLPVGVTIAALVALALAELAAPVLLEQRLGQRPWNAGHIAERFSLLTLITLGEVVAATTAAVGALTRSRAGPSPPRSSPPPGSCSRRGSGGPTSSSRRGRCWRCGPSAPSPGGTRTCRSSARSPRSARGCGSPRRRRGRTSCRVLEIALPSASRSARSC